ncbi:MAG: Dam family site-specific DNA-(adenine-N6)-methyltransferase, partial [Pirellulaceae bacterium]|nr:Dam family site-specific DNA-(adenine-N6)-methyltransferase [Pirellulaceae bacterium]
GCERLPFTVVRDYPEDLISNLSKLVISHENYEEVKRSRRRSPIGRAARFIYLNRTAFNGLYRVNRQGQFNVPYGCKPSTVVCDADGIRSASARLIGAEVATAGFATTLERLRPSDAIFLDPPYTVKHNNNCFRRYNEQIFSWKDQECLAELATGLAKRGQKIVVMNALHKEVLRLYSPRSFLGFAVERPTNMSADTASRGRCTELLLISRAVDLTAGQARDILNSELGYDVQLARRG